MKKMKKREIIILCITFLVVLYGMYTFIFQPSSKIAQADPRLTMKSELKEIDSLVSNVAANLKESEASLHDVYIVERAEEDWLYDPFYASASSGTTEVVNFSYTGYIEYGESKVAIINGVDYQKGDMLEVPGFVLRDINASRIIIEDKNGQRKISIPFMEE